MHYNWKWSILVEQPYLWWLLSGFIQTLLISICAWIAAFTLGSFVGILRQSPSALWRKVAAFYVSIFRNIPLLLQMFLWFYVLPEVLPQAAGDWLKRDLPQPQIWTAMVCLGFYTSARIAEQVRSALLAIGTRQMNAALSIGMSRSEAFFHVLLPIVYRLQMPTLTNEAISIVKTSSVALTIGVFELTAQAHRIEEYTFQGIESFTAATLTYVALTTLVIAAMSMIERNYRVTL
ncbi:glutamate/aspartate transport system permease protein [Bradyrhizobium sp. USDA 326]|uniref:amino acid ABC transporter permease n=1 Tax=unclassified Bradyrhizobium TaxID=2631580 RepID=UPI0035166DD6